MSKFASTTAVVGDEETGASLMSDEVHSMVCPSKRRESDIWSHFKSSNNSNGDVIAS